MVNFVENPAKSVLCVGHISQSRYEDVTSMARYRTNLRSLYRTLSSEGIDTYLHVRWSLCDTVSASLLQAFKTELIADFRLPYIYLMGIFSNNAPFVETPPYTEYFDEAMFPQSDDDQLTENRLLCNVLKSVHTVLFDHTGVDPFVEAILNRASRQNKRLLDLNDLCLMK